MFLAQKMLGTLLMPSAFVGFGLVLGLVLLWTSRFHRAGRVLVSIATCAFLLLGWGIPFESVSRPLERRYSPLLDTDSVRGVRWIVILGGGHRVGAGLPVSSRPSESTVYRIVEGVRLQKLLPGSRLLFTGFDAGSGVSVAAVGRDLALALGVSATAILIEDVPRTTTEEAATVKKVIGEEPFILVTSAVHMPRAMFLFQLQGMTPVPAPTQHHASARARASWRRLLPNPERMLDADAAWHELLGLAWAKIVH